MVPVLFHGGFSLSVVPGDGAVRRTLELAGIDRVLPVAEHGFA